MVTYRLITDLVPKRGQLAWLVYGGNDGSVLAYKPSATAEDAGHWVKLLQTRTKSHGYWCVSLARLNREKPYKCHVQTVILHAFKSPAPADRPVAMHLNDDPDDNRSDNLDWGSKAKNAARKEHSLLRKAMREELVGASLKIECARRLPSKKELLRNILWRGTVEWMGTSVAATGQFAPDVANDLLYKWRKSRAGITIFPRKGQISQMPEKDEEFFQFLLDRGWACPTGFEAQKRDGYLTWQNQRFAHVLVRQSPAR